jgi:hypothetical protein
MKMSKKILILAISVAIFPLIFLKLTLYNNFKKNAWVFHSSRSNIEISKIDSIEIKDLVAMTYKYCKDSAYLEYNNIANYNLVTETKNTKLSIFHDFKRLPNFDDFQSPVSYSIFEPYDYLFMRTQGINYKRHNPAIILHAPICPYIKATNAVFYIDSIEPNASFDFDLDFSTCYWQNFQWKENKFTRSNTIPWQLNRLKLKLNQSKYYLSKGVYFKEVEIDAERYSELEFENDQFKGYKISIDSTVIVRAPVNILNNLNLKITSKN